MNFKNGKWSKFQPNKENNCSEECTVRINIAKFIAFELNFSNTQLIYSKLISKPGVNHCEERSANRFYAP